MDGARYVNAAQVVVHESDRLVNLPSMHPLVSMYFHLGAKIDPTVEI